MTAADDANTVREAGLCPADDMCEPPNPKSQDCARCLAAHAALNALQAQAEAEKINPHVWDSQWNRRVIATEAERDRLQQALRQIEPVLNELIAWINTDISGCLEVEARGEAARLALRDALAGNQP